MKLLEQGITREASLSYLVHTRVSNSEARRKAAKLLNSEFVLHEFEEILVLLVMRLQEEEEFAENRKGVRRYLKSFLKKILFPVMDSLQEERDLRWRREHRDEQLAARRVLTISEKDR